MNARRLADPATLGRSILHLAIVVFGLTFSPTHSALAVGTAPPPPPAEPGEIVGPDRADRNTNVQFNFAALEPCSDSNYNRYELFKNGLFFSQKNVSVGSEGCSGSYNIIFTVDETFELSLKHFRSPTDPGQFLPGTHTIQIGQGSPPNAPLLQYRIVESSVLVGEQATLEIVTERYDRCSYQIGTGLSPNESLGPLLPAPLNGTARIGPFTGLGFHTVYLQCFGDIDSERSGRALVTTTPPRGIRSGDINGDGLRDIYIANALDASNANLTVNSPTKPILLTQTPGGNFTATSPVPGTLATQISSWFTTTAIQVDVRDISLDGIADLETIGIPAFIPGAKDQIVIAPNASAPARSISRDAKFQKTFADFGSWVLNKNYFNEAPLRAVGVQPPSRVYFGSAKTLGVSALNQLINLCGLSAGGPFCGFTDSPPSQCDQFLELFDADGASLGFGFVNVCIEFDVHVFVYIPGSIRFERDFSVFDEDARDAAEIADKLAEGCGGLTVDEEGVLRDIEENVFGPLIGGGTQVDNSISHVSFPGDSAFSPADPTFHHYDVITKVCNQTETGCTLADVREVLRLFSYPSRKLQPRRTNLTTDRPIAYVSLTPRIPSTFVLRAALPLTGGGHITQRQLAASHPFYPGAIQNITEPDHIVFPGTISRVALTGAQLRAAAPGELDPAANDNAIYIFTHGIGINRAHCLFSSPFLAYQNDELGAIAFKTLDFELIKLWFVTRGPGPQFQAVEGTELKSLEPEPEALSPTAISPVGTATEPAALGAAASGRVAQ